MSQLEDSIFDDADVLTPSGRFERRQRPRRPKGGYLRRWLTLLLALGLLGGAAYGALNYWRPIYNQLTASNDYAGPGEGEAKVVVKPGDLGNAIGKTLYAAGVVKSVEAFVDATRDSTESQKLAASIQPGTYTLKKQMKASDALVALTDAKNRFVQRVTVREGLWAQEVYPILAKATGVPLKDYQAAAKDPKALGLPAAAKGNVEGWLFPSTYEFPDKATAAQQLAIMVKKTVDELAKAGVAPADQERIMVLASLVEAEARHDVDRPKIARVFLNRIDNVGKSPTYGLLQSDASLAYGLKKRVVNLTKSELENQSNPYNLRYKPGLPPGPISNPGAKSIEAAAHPADGPWFFFVAVNPDTGETKYATTIGEHEKNVAEFQAWCQANKDRC